MVPDELQEKSLAELRSMAKTLGVKNVGKYRKNELVEMLARSEAPAPKKRGRPAKAPAADKQEPAPAAPEERKPEPAPAAEENAQPEAKAPRKALSAFPTSPPP